MSLGCCHSCLETLPFTTLNQGLQGKEALSSFKQDYLQGETVFLICFLQFKTTCAERMKLIPRSCLPHSGVTLGTETLCGLKSQYKQQDATGGLSTAS